MKNEIVQYLKEKGFEEIESNVFQKTDVQYQYIIINNHEQKIPKQINVQFKLIEGCWISNSKEEDIIPMIQIECSFNNVVQDSLLVKDLEDFKSFINL